MKNLFIFLPGLGADGRLFSFQRAVFKNSICPQWIAPQKDESLPNYARRWAKQLKLKKHCILVGVSFGGMVALEMARWIKPKAVLLVGSCRSPESIPLFLRVGGGIPGWPFIGKILARVFPFGRGWVLGAKTKAQQDLLLRMFLETPNGFLRWTVSAIRGWAGFKGVFFNIHHVHGDKDHLIPIENVVPDQVIQGGGHTIILSHSKEVNEFIRKWSGLKR